MKKKIKISMIITWLLVNSFGITAILASYSLNGSSVESIKYTSKKMFKELPYISQESAWDANGSYVCLQSANQDEPQICSDGAGGAIITWMDERIGFNYFDIYAQRIDSNGLLQWDVNGTAICTEDLKQMHPKIISDGAGGAIIVWVDAREGFTDYNIYTQRIDSNGIIQWNANGTVICNENENQWNVRICSDGAGGAIIAWDDSRNAPNIDIFAQRIDSSGTVLWSLNGIAICTESHNQYSPQICSDGAGGAIIAWVDTRNGDEDIYAQRIDSDGAVQWEGNGLAICTEVFYQKYLQLCSDGAEGAIITWQDERVGFDVRDIYIQRIDSNGIIKWVDNGTAICTAFSNQYYPQICSDGAGGAIVTWSDYRTGTNYDIYVQHINLNGTIQWTNNGKPICTADYSQSNPQICSDGAGGAIITWNDVRNNNDNDIYALRIDSTGVIKWMVNGIGICMADNHQYGPQINTDGAGTFIITWEDKRSGQYDIYAQKIINPPPISNNPSDIETSIGGTETINWTLYDDSAGGKYRVLANNSIVVDWTSWANNTALYVPINRTNPGYFDYTIQYYDDQHNFGVPDSVIVRITKAEDGFKIDGYSLIILLSCSFGLILILTKKLKHLRKF